MIDVRLCKKHGVCNSCGVTQDHAKIMELRFSVTGQGWTTIMLCPACLKKLKQKFP